VVISHLPPEPVYFADRQAERARILDAVQEWDLASRAQTIALTGVAGVGKTELAFHIARLLRARYPDGILYVDLDELRSDGVVDGADALGELLRWLDVPPEWQERVYRDRRKQFWSLTEGKRLLVIVDNARFGAEVLPLLPASGSSLALFISHGPLYDLEDGAGAEIALSPLETEDAGELLRHLVVGDPRLSAEPEAVEGILRLCSGLPGAVDIVGRRIRKFRRRPLARLLTQLETEFQEKGLPVVERVWDAAYGGLGENAALLYRLLGEMPGRSFTAEAAAALLGRDREAADEALEELELSGLLDGRHPRMRLPELLLTHARRRARRDGSEQERAGARRRIVQWYLRQAQRADLLAAGDRLVLAESVDPLPGAPDFEFGASDEQAGRLAYQWLESERRALYACVRLAYAMELHGTAWALCEALWTHFLDHPHRVDAAEAFSSGVADAQRTGHLPALIRMRTQLARPLWELERFEESAEQLEQALSAARSLGGSSRERKVAASALEARGMLHAAQGEWAAAVPCYERARQEHVDIKNAYGVMLQTYRLGEAAAALGELDRAAGLLKDAHTRARALKRARPTARTGFALGGVLRALGRMAEARPLYALALTDARERHSSFDEARVLDAFAALAEESGDAAEADGHRGAARAVRERNGGLG
jgi:tetratricopeptide (TPR) repeat protein